MFAKQPWRIVLKDVAHMVLRQCASAVCVCMVLRQYASAVCVCVCVRELKLPPLMSCSACFVFVACVSFSFFVCWCSWFVSFVGFWRNGGVG